MVQQLLRFLTVPVLLGLVVALAYIAFWGKPATSTPKEIILVEQQVVAEPQQSTVSLANTISYADAVSRAQPAVVNISTTKSVEDRSSPFFNDPVLRRFFGLNEAPRREKVTSSLGSGVIISPSGYVLTNNHVISGAEEITVALADGRETLATVVGTDPWTDLALLTIDLPNLPSVRIAMTDNLRVGDVVLAIGNPFNIGQTVTKGIISALGRPETELSSFVDYIQTDAAINPGNSGGALIDAFGTLVGINTAIFSTSGGYHGIGFAIPAVTAVEVVKELLRHGQVIRGWLGLEPQALTPSLAQALKLPDPDIEGLLVVGLIKNGPAHTAGILPGDIMTSINGQKIESPREAINMISQMKPGTRATIGVIRSQEPVDVLVVVGARPTLSSNS